MNLKKNIHTHMQTHTHIYMLFATLWTVALQAPLSMGLSRQEYWSGLPCPLLGDLPDPGIKPRSLMSPALAGGFFTTSATWKPSPHIHTCAHMYVRTHTHTYKYI